MTALTATTGFIRIGWRRALGERLVIAVPLLTYALLVAVFASIFKVTPLHELPDHLRVTAPALIWYLVLTEMITFSGGYTFPEVRNDVGDGQFTASLPRPISYFHTKLWGWMGQSAVRVLAFFVAGLALGTIFSGEFLYSWKILPIALLSVYLGAMLHGLIYFSLALLDVWGPYARPVMWISQKFCFLLGGLLLPISFYPGWLQNIAWATPYPAVLYLSGRLAFGLSQAEIIYGLLLQCLWLGVMTGIAFLMQYLATQKILQRGH